MCINCGLGFLTVTPLTYVPPCFELPKEVPSVAYIQHMESVTKVKGTVLKTGFHTMKYSFGDCLVCYILYNV